MVYSQTPFAHITHLVSKLDAIKSSRHIIKYPAEDKLGQPVPPMVIEAIQGCLHRDPKRRMTIPQLLAHPMLQW
jgi:hypothetical protein